MIISARMLLNKFLNESSSLLPMGDVVKFWIDWLYMFIYYCFFLYLQPVLRPRTFLTAWKVLCTLSFTYQRTAIMSAPTTQAVTVVLVTVDMNWILMKSLALVRNIMNNSNFNHSIYKHFIFHLSTHIRNNSSRQNCSIQWWSFARWWVQVQSMLIDLEFMLKSVEFAAKVVALVWRQLRNLSFLKSAVKLFKSLESNI